MIQKIDKIIRSKTAPKDVNVLWDNGEDLKINRNSKWEPIGVPSDQRDMIQKLLDAYGDLPENLDSIREIANTPANFLNNNNELGGLINMPFGLQAGEFFSKYVKVDKDEEVLICNISNSYYYGKMIVVVNGGLKELETSNTDTYIPANFGYIYINSTTHDVIYKAPPYMSYEGTISVRTHGGYAIIPTEYLPVKSCGNTSQAEVDNFIEFFNNPSAGEVVDLNLYINSTTTPTLLRSIIQRVNTYTCKIYGFHNTTNGEIKCYSSQNFDIRKIEPGKTLSECGISIYVSKTIREVKPDWNATSSSDPGYIQNRTHYGQENPFFMTLSESERIITASSYTEPFDYWFTLVAQGTTLEKVFIGKNDFSTHTVEYGNYVIWIQRTTANKFSISKGDFALNINAKRAVQQLDEMYIPDTIARKDEYGKPVTKIDSSTKTANVQILNSITEQDAQPVYYSVNQMLRMATGQLYNRCYIVGFDKGRIKKLRINDDGSISTVVNVNIDSLLSYAIVKEGESEDDATYNYESLISMCDDFGEKFPICINNCIGTATWNPDDGGYAWVTDSDGFQEKYNIGQNGAVTKEELYIELASGILSERFTVKKGMIWKDLIDTNPKFSAHKGFVRGTWFNGSTPADIYYEDGMDYEYSRVTIRDSIVIGYTYEIQPEGVGGQ